MNYLNKLFKKLKIKIKGKNVYYFFSKSIATLYRVNFFLINLNNNQYANYFDKKKCFTKKVSISNELLTQVKNDLEIKKRDYYKGHKNYKYLYYPYPSEYLKQINLAWNIDRKKYLSIMSKADIGLVSLAGRMSSHNYPLKMIGYMQLSKPILASVNKNNEIISMFQESNIGYASLAQDKECFNKNLAAILSSKVLRKEQGQNALKLFEEKFTVKVATQQIFENF